jgi:xanthine dehydrogenase accessory factor
MDNGLVLGSAPADGLWPTYGLVDDVRDRLAVAREAGDTLALATLVAVDGPSPRPLGAQMAIAADKSAVGYVSGGCVEGSLAILGADVIKTGLSRRVVFGAGSPFIDVQLVCGARIEVFIERIAPNDASIAAVLNARANRCAIVREVGPDGAMTRAATRYDASAMIDNDRIARRYDPTTRLIVCGHDPVALALADLSEASGLRCTLVRALGPAMAPPGLKAEYRAQSPLAAFAALGLDPWTAVVTTTHDLESDHEILAAALASEAFYVGALGSRRRVAHRIAKLEKAGLDWAAVKRLRAPVGLDIGAATPHEIAISILADIVRAQRKPQ